MKKLSVIVMKNQNEVSKSECEKIRRSVKKEFSDYRLNVIANKDLESAKETAKDNSCIVFWTKDVNSEVWAELDKINSDVFTENEIIALN